MTKISRKHPMAMLVWSACWGVVNVVAALTLPALIGGGPSGVVAFAWTVVLVASLISINQRANR